MVVPRAVWDLSVLSNRSRLVLKTDKSRVDREGVMVHILQLG